MNVIDARCVCPCVLASLFVCVILSAFSRCYLPPFGDPPASPISRYLGNSGLPRVCAAVRVCVRVGGRLSVNYDSSCSVQSGYPHTPVWGTPTHICCLAVCPYVPSIHLSSLSVVPSLPTLFSSVAHTWICIERILILKCNVYLLFCLLFVQRSRGTH